MSAYSTTLKASYFDPRVDISGNTCEFRLDSNTAYMPNLRIANLGFTMNVEHTTAELVGFYGVVKNIRLMDGNVELSTLRHANRYLSWKNITDNNQNNLCVKAPLSKASVGYVLNDKQAVEHPSGILKMGDKTGKTSVADADEIHAAHLPLEFVFPLLKKIPYLDTTIHENLRVVIEYERDVKMLATDTAGTLKDTLSPVLIADEVIDPKMVASMRKTLNSVIWYEIEHDQFRVGANVPGAGVNDGVASPQTVNAIINGFDNKFVSRVIMMDAYADRSDGFFAAGGSLGYGNYASLNMPNKAIQIRHNGANVFAGDGLQRDSDRAMITAQTWGDVNILPFSNKQNVGAGFSEVQTTNLDGAPFATTDFNATAGINPRVGQQDYLGFQIDSRVNQLAVTYKRDSFKDQSAIEKRSQLAVDCHLYAEVLKNINYSGNSYNVQYA